MLATLDEVLAYEHPAVVRRFKKEHPAHADRAETIFKDLMRFFWCSKRHYLDKTANPSNESLQFTFIMDEDMRIIDQMWHVFLLYTQDYMDYCERYFKEYLHHLPDIVPTFEAGSFDFETNLVKFLDYTYEHLGEEVVRRWFASSLAATACEPISA